MAPTSLRKQHFSALATSVELYTKPSTGAGNESGRRSGMERLYSMHANMSATHDAVP